MAALTFFSILLLFFFVPFFDRLQESNNMDVTQQFPVLCQQELMCLLKTQFSICFD